MHGMDDAELIAAFVESFAQLDDGMFFFHDNPPPPELDAGIDPNDWRILRWRPASIPTDATHFADFCWRLGRRLPRLYEKLITSYRWLEVSLGTIRLMANPPGNSLEVLRRNITADPVFESHLIRGGFIPFALDANVYDPICFDVNRMDSNFDCPIVRFEHEAMLSFDRIGNSWILWPSVEAMMVEIVDAGRAKLRPT
jgi:hypothetical protein